MTVRKARSGRRRGGYTFTEMVVVSLLLVILTSILATVWTAFCRPARAVAARCRLATEANLLANSLARDLGGYLPGSFGQAVLNDGSLDPSAGCLVGVRVPDPANPTALQLCYHGVNADPSRPNDMTPKWSAPDVVVNYLLCPTHLNHVVRVVGTVGPTCPFGGTAVGNEVSAFTVADWPAGQPQQGCQVTFTVRSAELATADVTMTYNLVALGPAPSTP